MSEKDKACLFVLLGLISMELGIVTIFLHWILDAI